MSQPAANPFSPQVQADFDSGAKALDSGDVDDATAHLTQVAMQGNDRDRYLLADFLLAARDTSR